MSYKVKDRIKFLSDASKILASSLDYNVTLANIARLVVNKVADFCMIDLYKGDVELHRVASHVADKSKQKLAQEMFNYPPEPRNKKAIYEAARIGKAIFVKRLSKKWLNMASQSKGEHRVVKELGMRSFIFAPMKSRNRVIGVLTLISNKKNFEYSKKDMTLAEELASRAGVAVDNAHLYSRAQTALQQRDLFISMAAHELRTPITTISGYAQMLNSKFAGADTPEARWIKNLSWETLRLGYLVNELLEVNRIGDKTFEFIWRECRLKEIIERAISDFRFIHPGHKIIFQDYSKDHQDKVIGDFNKLLQVVINLLDNAAKFSPSKTEIIARLLPKKRYVHLLIEDYGKGISKRDQRKVFEKFYRGENHTREGMGMGLFLVKNIMLQHCGSINIKSTENKGTKVEIKLPRAK